MLVSGGRANLHDALVPLREGSSCFNLSTPRAQDWLSPQGINATAKWRNWCRQMLLLIYLRPLWHSVGQYLQDYSNLQDPAKTKRNLTAEALAARVLLRSQRINEWLHCSSATPGL